MVSDTGLWRLVMLLSDRSLKAWLRRTDTPDEPMHLIAEAQWADDDTLTNIENAIYDNPTLLDDFEADVIISSPRFVCLPQALQVDDEDAAKAYSLIFGEASPAEVMTDTSAGYSFCYLLTGGLRSFLTRTLAGARVSSEMAKLAEYWKKIAGEGRILFADYSEGALNYALYNFGELLLATSRSWDSPEDAAYYLLSALALDNNNPTESTLSLSGEKLRLDPLVMLLEKTGMRVVQTPAPSSQEAPLAALVCAFRNSSSNL